MTASSSLVRLIVDAICTTSSHSLISFSPTHLQKLHFRFIPSHTSATVVDCSFTIT
uniref:Uncharacterized protein n=1 Tax=Arundo donax TaxID=35708 RepID=A0A0A8YCM4_ARUDO